MERTLIILKPDAVDRRLVGQLIQRFERKGLQILGLKMMRISKDMAAKHYEAHKGKEFYQGLVEFMTASPVMVMALAGANAVQVCRKLMGVTAGHEADPGTIRGDYGMSPQFNLVHGSDSDAAAARELELFFEARELMEYRTSDQRWFL